MANLANITVLTNPRRTFLTKNAPGKTFLTKHAPEKKFLTKNDKILTKKHLKKRYIKSFKNLDTSAK